MSILIREKYIQYGFILEHYLEQLNIKYIKNIK